MENISYIIREQNPSLVDWSVTSTVVMNMQQIVCSIVKKQASGGKWIIYESIVYTVRVCIYFYGDEVDEFLKVELEQMME